MRQDGQKPDLRFSYEMGVVPVVEFPPKLPVFKGNQKETRHFAGSPILRRMVIWPGIFTNFGRGPAPSLFADGSCRQARRSFGNPASQCSSLRGHKLTIVFLVNHKAPLFHRVSTCSRCLPGQSHYLNPWCLGTFGRWPFSFFHWRKCVFCCIPQWPKPI